MKHIYLQMAASVAATFALGTSAACAQQQDGTGDPIELLVEDESEGTDWNDQPQTPGTWEYVVDVQGPRAVFGIDKTKPDFILRCTGQRVALARRAAGQPIENLTMVIKTETASRILTAMLVPSARPSNALVAVGLEPNDPLLDAMAITQGRFAIEVEGMEPLYLPAWAEVTRVIEDCR